MQIKSVRYKEKERILLNALTRAKPLTAKEEYNGTTPAPFVGKYGYPNINVGLMSPQQHDEEAWKYDAPKYWSNNNLQISDVVNYRTALVNSKFLTNAKNPDKLVNIAQQAAMATKPIDIEVKLHKKPNLNLTTDQYTAPMGPQAQLKKLEMTSNPHIHTKVQRFYDDTDALASEAITTLYNHNFDENALSRMLSVGTFGKQRKIVPTRWSITATDDIIANQLLTKVKDQPIGEYEAHFGNYLGNYYLILKFPEKWSYELFEMYVENSFQQIKMNSFSSTSDSVNGVQGVSPGTLEYSTDHEDINGRKDYAQNCAGGYYTVRMALAQNMIDNKRQNKTIALRFITDEYLLPLGVWVTREATRKTLSNKPIKFANKELMLNYAQQLAKHKFGLDITPILKQSKLLNTKQAYLNDYQ